MENNTNFRTLDLVNYQVILEENGNEPLNLIDIIDTEKNLKLSKGELDNKNISRLIFELISLRMGSERLVADMADENNKLRADNEDLADQVAYLLDKYNASEEFIEENRGKLEQ